MNLIANIHSYFYFYFAPNFFFKGFGFFGMDKSKKRLGLAI